MWSYWHQGFDSAPITVVNCQRQLKKFHHGMEENVKINFLCKNTLSYHIEPELIDKYKSLTRGNIAWFSDLVRLELLINFGGVWIDPTVYLIKPLDLWYKECVQSDSVLFLFTKPGRDRCYANWFIWAESDNYTLLVLRNELIKYWESVAPDNKIGDFIGRFLHRYINNRGVYLSLLWLNPIFKRMSIKPYFIFHYILNYLSIMDYDVRSELASMSEIPAENCFLLEKSTGNHQNKKGKEKISIHHTWMQKLSWKRKYNLNDLG